MFIGIASYAYAYASLPLYPKSTYANPSSSLFIRYYDYLFIIITYKGHESQIINH